MMAAQNTPKNGLQGRTLLLGGLLALVTLGCDSYNKILKNPNLNFKFQIEIKMVFWLTKAKQQKLLQAHNNKMRKDTLDKTIETINQMKVSSQQASGRKSATYTSKKNSI